MSNREVECLGVRPGEIVAGKFQSRSKYAAFVLSLGKAEGLCAITGRFVRRATAGLDRPQFLTGLPFRTDAHGLLACLRQPRDG